MMTCCNLVSSNVLAGFLLSFWDVEASAGSAVVVVVDGLPVAELAVTVDVDPEVKLKFWEWNNCLSVYLKLCSFLEG